MQVRLLCSPTDETDSKRIAVKAILEQAATIKGNNQLQAMLTDWFELMNLEKWQQKWNTKNEEEHVQNRNSSSPPKGELEGAFPLGGGGAALHSTWIEESGITATPTFFINGKKLPRRYDLQAVEKLIPNMAAELAV